MIRKLFSCVMKQNGPNKAEDFLSYSPSLFDILCYVEQNDILNCKLISRRLYEVIKYNDKYLPRINARLRLDFLHDDKEGNTIYARICNEHEQKEKFSKILVLENKPIIMIECHNQLIAGSFEKKVKTHNDELRSISNKLRTLLEILFRPYYFTFIMIRNIGKPHQEQGEYCSVICDVLRTSFSKCPTLMVDGVTWGDLTTLFTKLECEKLYLQNMNDLNNRLLSFLTDFPSKLCVEIKGTFNLSLICDIVKSWESGDYRCKGLRIQSEKENQPDAQELCVNLMSASWFDVSSHTKDYTKCFMEFKRPIDDSILYLKYDAMVTQKYFHLFE